jgi:RNA polymerase sigma-70 factor (ECF subfamily)
VRGSAAVAQTFSGRAQAARLALVDGAPGAVWTHGGQPRVVLGLAIEDGRILGIDLDAGPERLGRLELVPLDP